MRIEKERKVKCDASSIYHTDIPMYNLIDGSIDMWNKYHDELNVRTWSEIIENCENVDDKLEIFYENVQNAIKNVF